MTTDCIFCKIVAGEIPSDQLHSDDLVTAFRDINPAAPTHVLIIPNEHLASMNEMTFEHESMMGHVFTIAHQLAESEGIAENGYRMIINTGPHGGQLVNHLHLHLLGGKRMRYPVG